MRTFMFVFTDFSGARCDQTKLQATLTAHHIDSRRGHAHGRLVAGWRIDV
jgi:hypothetical protein